MARDSEREIFDGCSRPRLTPLAKTDQELNQEFIAREVRRRELANRVGDMVDWGMLYDHKR